MLNRLLLRKYFASLDTLGVEEIQTSLCDLHSYVGKTLDFYHCEIMATLLLSAESIFVLVFVCTGKHVRNNQKGANLTAALNEVEQTSTIGHYCWTPWKPAIQNEEYSSVSKQGYEGLSLFVECRSNSSCEKSEYSTDKAEWIYKETLKGVIIFVILLYVSKPECILSSRNRHWIHHRVKPRGIFCHKWLCYSCISQLCARKFYYNVDIPIKRLNIDILNNESYNFKVFCLETCRTVINYLSLDGTSSSSANPSELNLSMLYDIKKDYIPVQESVVLPLFYAVTRFLDRSREHLSLDEEMCYEVRRFQSFNSVPIRASPMRLAQSGFYATGTGDETRCYSCRESHRDWRLMDQPDQIHRSISPDCPHLNRRDDRNVPIESDDNDSEVTTVFGILREYSSRNVSNEYTRFRSEVSVILTPETPQAVAAATHTARTSTSSHLGLDISKSVYPLYRELSSRLDSYQGWGSSHIQDPQVLARAGFFYAGYRDCVRCFYCGIGLRTWEREDDPWVEHVRWRSSCDYIRVVKGEQFIIQALAGDPSLRPSSLLNIQTQTSQRTVTADGTDVIARAQEMGFQRDHIERVMAELTGPQNRNRVGQNDVIQLETLLEKLLSEGTHSYPGSVGPPMSHASTAAAQSQQTMSSASSDVESPQNMQHTDTTTVRCLSSSGVKDDASASETILKKAECGQVEQNSTDIRTTGTRGNECRNQRTSGENNTANEVEILSVIQERQLEEENQSMRDESTCKICMDNPSCIVFLPCGHLVTCAECAPALRKCPICRAVIRGTVRAYTVSKDS